MSKKCNEACLVLNYNDNLFILIFANNGCISISVFVILIGIPISIASASRELKLCVIATGNKNCKFGQKVGSRTSSLKTDPFLKKCCKWDVVNLLSFFFILLYSRYLRYFHG